MQYPRVNFLWRQSAQKHYSFVPKLNKRISGIFYPQAFKNYQIDEIKIVLIKRTYRLAKTNFALIQQKFPFQSFLICFHVLPVSGCRVIITVADHGSSNEDK